MNQDAGGVVMLYPVPPTPDPLDPDNDPWERASCRRVDAEMFFSDDARAAKRICGVCPVKDPCLEYALQNREEHGIWGATSAKERRAMLKLRPDIPKHNKRGKSKRDRRLEKGDGIGVLPKVFRPNRHMTAWPGTVASSAGPETEEQVG